MSSQTKYSEPLLCLHCENTGVMEVMLEFGSPNPIPTRANEFAFDCMADEEHFDVLDGPEFSTEWVVLRCSVCKRPTLRTGELIDGTCYDDDYVTVFPPPPRTPDGLPEQIRSAYQKALRQRTIDPDAFAVLLGRVLTELCNEHDIPGSNLFERLNRLADDLALPADLRKATHRIRELRNVGAHAEFGSLSAMHVPILESLCRALLEYIYFGPALLGKVKEHLASAESLSPKAMSSK